MDVAVPVSGFEREDGESLGSLRLRLAKVMGVGTQAISLYRLDPLDDEAAPLPEDTPLVCQVRDAGLSLGKVNRVLHENKTLKEKLERAGRSLVLLKKEVERMTEAEDRRTAAAAAAAGDGDGDGVLNAAAAEEEKTAQPSSAKGVALLRALEDEFEALAQRILTRGAGTTASTATAAASTTRPHSGGDQQ